MDQFVSINKTIFKQPYHLTNQTKKVTIYHTLSNNSMTFKTIISAIILKPFAHFIADTITDTASLTIKTIINHDAVTAGLGKAQETIRDQIRDPNSVTTKTTHAIKSTALFCKKAIVDQVTEENSITRRFIQGLRTIFTQTAETVASPQPRG